MLHDLIHTKDNSHRRELAELLNEAPFDPALDPTDRRDMQRRVYEQLRILNKWAGSGSALIRDRLRLFSALEFAATVSPALFHVAQAHYGVCLSTIVELGNPSKQLEAIIQDLDSLVSIAAILITELGVGCSHLAVATTAVYEPDGDYFVLSTPDKAACKIMANVSLEGVAKTGVVFAQMWSGGKNYGLFPFIVPIRDEKRVRPGIHVKPLPGNSVLGMDYTLVSFDQVRVPRENWLGDTAILRTDSSVVDPLESVDRRLVRSLSGGSNASTATAVGASAVARACVWTALRYAAKRKTMGPLGKGRAILEFRNQQTLLFGALAETFVISNLSRQLVEGQPAATTTISSMATAPWAAINRVAALTKAIAVAGASEVIRNCRRVSGAHGGLGANRFGNYEDLVVAYASAGGDNQLILIEIGRELASGVCPIDKNTKLPESLDTLPSVFQLAEFEERRQYDRATAGLSLSDLGSQDLYSVWNSRLTAVIHLAQIHGCRIALEGLLDSATGKGNDRKIIEAIATIYAVRNFGDALSYESRDLALARSFDIVMANLEGILDAFGLSPELIPVPMASSDYVSAYVEGGVRIEQHA
jgi:acyl-CoA oxidase